MLINSISSCAADLCRPGTMWLSQSMVHGCYITCHSRQIFDALCNIHGPYYSQATQSLTGRGGRPIKSRIIESPLFVETFQPLTLESEDYVAGHYRTDNSNNPNAWFNCFQLIQGTFDYLNRNGKQYLFKQYSHQNIRE